jgi:hypothetical protein
MSSLTLEPTTLDETLGMLAVKGQRWYELSGAVDGDDR